MVQPHIACTGRAPILLVDEFDVGILSRQSRAYLSTTIRRTVIHENNFIVSLRDILIFDGLHAPLQILLYIIYWYYNG